MLGCRDENRRAYHAGRLARPGGPGTTIGGGEPAQISGAGLADPIVATKLTRRKTDFSHRSCEALRTRFPQPALLLVVDDLPGVFDHRDGLEFDVGEMAIHPLDAAEIFV